MNTRKYRNAVKNLTASLKPEIISHLALVIIAVAIRNKQVFSDYFPEMRDSPGVREILQKG